MREGCCHCPETRGLFFPPGIDGFLHHMEKSHPYLYWATDDFTIIG